MSATRIVFLIILVLLVGAYAIYSAPGSFAYMWLSGQCQLQPAPAICARGWVRHHGIVYYTPHK